MPRILRQLALKKHVLVEKPMALSLEDCRAMISAARKSGVQLVVGHSHSFDAPILHTRKLIQRKTYGAVRMITALDFTDFVYRPRRPEELATGGAVLNQAAHHVDIVRLLAGGNVRSVRAYTGNWDKARPTEGAYSCVLDFDNGVFAAWCTAAMRISIPTNSWAGSARWDSGRIPSAYGMARKAL